MDILIVLFLVFVALPFLLLIWLPGWKSFAVAAVLLLGLSVWFWVGVATMPPRTGTGAAVVGLLRYAFAASVLAGIAIKAVWLHNRRSGARNAR
ncbi:hypothetical protein [Mesorhizobium xinjiangense]|uniref:hypothetical protein n=1 Tax=Mesorhizobium xinjiangense TaxID=2678685 RepID=UPI0012ED1DEB|nr:hypothetical protein [Mesorhizobium xinjiangense]